MHQVVVGKWLSAYLPSLVLATVAIGVFHLAQRLGPWVFARNLLILAPILAAETALLVAVGAMRPNFEWSDPKDMAGGMTGCLGGLAAWLFMILMLALVALGLALPLVIGWPPVWGLLAWAVVSGVCVAVVLAAWGLAARKLAAVEM
jgi:hypothetical protein